MAGAIQPRVNKAIIDRLSADTVTAELLPGTSLQELLRDAGGLLEPGWRLPLYCGAAPASAKLPAIVYGPTDPRMEINPLRTGDDGDGETEYQITYEVDGMQAYETMAVVDRITDLLDAFSVTVSGVKFNFKRTGSVFFVDYAARESGVTVSGATYRVLTRPT